MPDELDNVIQDVAEGPANAQTDGTSFTQHNLKDLIEADRYLRSKNASRGKFPLKMTRMESPGAI